MGAKPDSHGCYKYSEEAGCLPHFVWVTALRSVLMSALRSAHRSAHVANQVHLPQQVLTIDKLQTKFKSNKKALMSSIFYNFQCRGDQKYKEANVHPVHHLDADEGEA